MATITDGSQDLTLDLDGFIFENVQLGVPISTALMTPLKGVEPGEVTVYNNILNLMTIAVLYREEWKDNSSEVKTRFINAVARHWGLAGLEDTYFLVEMVTSARERYMSEEDANSPELRESLHDNPSTVEAIRDILRATKVLASVQDIHGPVVPHRIPCTVICEGLVSLTQADITSRGIPKDEIDTQRIAAIINRMLSPAYQRLVQQTIEESQAPCQGCPLIVSIRDNILRKLRTAVSNAYQEERMMIKAVLELEGWNPRLSYISGTMHRPAITEVASDLGQDNEVVDGDGIIILPVKREHDGSEAPGPKRVRENTGEDDGEDDQRDDDDDVPATTPRNCIVM
ncbi:hypothetical protein F4805DRAFT_472525 [Annulohypoxylon moriforme]|nr:hypothetical protein F4805DRAFT_472525 [Annulohypoxylon moriforme]